MVTRAARQTASNVNDLLEQRDILGLLAVAGGTAGGVILTQRVANRVLPLVGLSPTPQTITEGVASAGTKGLIGAGFMYGALQTSGVGKVLLAFLSLGSLGSAGFDLIQLFIEVPDVAQMQQTSASRTKSAGSVTANLSPSTSNSTSASARATSASSTSTPSSNGTSNAAF
jgi:hypothetical protein